MGALVVYAVLNVSRLAVLSGVARLAWRSLSPNCFTYRATTTYEGMYLGAPFSGKYASFKQMLQKELGKEIKLYERLGWFTHEGVLALPRTTPREMAASDEFCRPVRQARHWVFVEIRKIVVGREHHEWHGNGATAE